MSPNKVEFYLFLEIRYLLIICDQMAFFDFIKIHIKIFWGHPWHPNEDTLIRANLWSQSALCGLDTLMMLFDCFGKPNEEDFGGARKYMTGYRKKHPGPKHIKAELDSIIYRKFVRISVFVILFNFDF